jgi:hypothetical protein
MILLSKLPLLTHVERVVFRRCILTGNVARTIAIWSRWGAITKPAAYIASLHFSTVYQVDPQGETSITNYKDDASSNLFQGQSMSSQVDPKIPENDYYRGHLLCDQLEYVNDTIEKIEDSINTLDDLNTKKRSVFTKSIGLMSDSSRNDLKNLFEESTATKIAMKNHLTKMKEMLKSRPTTDGQKLSQSFAVDAPDGMSDDCIRQEMEEVKQILDDTPTLKQKAEALKAWMIQNRASTTSNNGVDAPDGTCDGMTQDEIRVIQYILNNSKKC